MAAKHTASVLKLYHDVDHLANWNVHCSISMLLGSPIVYLYSQRCCLHARTVKLQANSTCCF